MLKCILANFYLMSVFDLCRCISLKTGAYEREDSFDQDTWTNQILIDSIESVGNSRQICGSLCVEKDGCNAFRTIPKLDGLPSNNPFLCELGTILPGFTRVPGQISFFRSTNLCKKFRTQNIFLKALFALTLH